METPRCLKTHQCFDGLVQYYQHHSLSTGTDMRFSVYLPPQAAQGRVPVLYFLSGLTCTEENFMVKAGAQAYAAQHGLMLVVPDTSPRGAGVPGEDESSDLGTGAGFYVDATQAPWARHYRMHSYVQDELPHLIATHFPAQTNRQSVMGHSMGGHGAMVLGLRHPQQYRSISAFAPICAPSRCPWGEKAFSAYLGEQRQEWLAYDSTHLLLQTKGSKEPRLPLLVDQGGADPFLATQLHPELLLEACREAQYPLTYRWQGAYDHSYHFIATFIGDHIAFHARFLKTSG